MSGGVPRKTRSDKKRGVKPTICVQLKSAIYRLAYITNTPVKDVCEKIVQTALADSNIIGHLALNFRRDIKINNTIYIGHYDVAPPKRWDDCNTERISLRLKEEDYELLCALAYALDCRPTRACGILIGIGMRDYKFVNNYVKRYLHGKLSEREMKELRKIMRYVNGKSTEYFSWMAVLGHIVEETGKPLFNAKDTIQEFILKNWQD